MPTGGCASSSDDRSAEGGAHSVTISSSGGLQRKRHAAELCPGESTRQRGEGGAAVPMPEHEAMQAYQMLTPTQKSIMRRVVSGLDSEQDSVVITNPLQPHGPIVYVTSAWQDMCGYNTQQAVGQNPRLTQGEGSDPETVSCMKRALCAQQPCRVRIINYRGYNREPFWNCLSVQPIFFNRQLVLFAARLQDYSHRLNRLVSLAPAQFCKPADSMTLHVRLQDVVAPKRLGRARCVDVTPSDLGEGGDSDSSANTDNDAGSACAGAVASPLTTVGGGGLSLGAFAGKGGMPGLVPRPVKRLGFGGLTLEPEYLLDRLRHECADMSLPYHAQEVQLNGAEVLRMEVTGRAGRGGAGGALGPAAGASGGAGSSSSSTDAAAASSGGAVVGDGSNLRMLLHVLPEDNEGTYAISLMRLMGDTFEFHALYRKLRDRLTDITIPAPAAGGRAPLPAVSGGGGGGGGSGV